MRSNFIIVMVPVGIDFKKTHFLKKLLTNNLKHKKYINSQLYITSIYFFYKKIKIKINKYFLKPIKINPFLTDRLFVETKLKTTSGSLRWKGKRLCRLLKRRSLFLPMRGSYFTCHIHPSPSFLLLLYNLFKPLASQSHVYKSSKTFQIETLGLFLNS